MSVDLDAMPAESTYRRALYVLPSGPTRVEKSHGALTIRTPGERVRHIPVSLVERIVCNHFVDWSGSALQLCLLSGVVICLRSRLHGLVGYGYPRVRPEEPLHQVLQRFMTRHDAAGRLDDWFRHCRMRVLRRWAKEQKEKARRAVPRAVFNDYKKRWVYRTEVTEVFPMTLHTSVGALVLSAFRDAGAAPAYLDSQGRSFPLMDPWVNLLWGELNLFSGLLAAGLAEGQTELTFIEGWISSRRATLVEDMQRFALFLAERCQE